MYLIEGRKRARADPGVRGFLERAVAAGEATYLSSVTLGELRRGMELMRHRGDVPQALLLETWLTGVLEEYADSMLSFDADAAQVRGGCAFRRVNMRSTSRSPPSR